MSDLINHLRIEREAVKRRAWHARRPKEQYNTLYFSNNIDVRLCPKNGCSSLKSLYSKISGVDGAFGVDQRRRVFTQHLTDDLISLDNNNFQFRHGSKRIAVARDPVERAVSAVKYLYQCELGNHNPSYKQVVDALNEFELRDNSHFFSQTFYMGTYDQYDHVYVIEDLNKLMAFLLNECSQLDVNHPLANTKKNVSKSTFKACDLPDHTVERIQALYHMDYESGWYSGD